MNLPGHVIQPHLNHQGVAHGSSVPILTNTFPVFQENPVFAQWHNYKRVEDIRKRFKEILGTFLRIYGIVEDTLGLPQKSVFWDTF